MVQPSVDTTQMKKMRQRVYAHMLQTRSWKYRAFLRYLRLFKYVALAPTRGSFLESYYVLMRYLDDVVDGDVRLPGSYENEAEFIQEKIHFSENPIHPRDEVDHLMLHCFELADRFSEDFTEETNDILSSLLFDAKRRNTSKIFPEDVLHHHFHRLDIRGTIRATLKVFKEDPNKYELLEPLGMASRYQFDLEDLETDIEAGYINISKEDCDRLGIEIHDLKNINSPGMVKWRFEHAAQGLKLLKHHHHVVSSGNFSLLSRITFPLVYERPARKTFEKELALTNALNRIKTESVT